MIISLSKICKNYIEIKSLICIIILNLHKYVSVKILQNSVHLYQTEFGVLSMEFEYFVPRERIEKGGLQYCFREHHEK